MTARQLLWLAIAINLVVATAPFRFDPPRLAQNRLEQRQDGALVFHDPSMARTMSAPAWIGDAIRTGSLSIDLQVKPASLKHSGPARILTITQDYTSQNLMIGQEQSDLVIRIRRPGARDDGEPAFIVPGAFEAGNVYDIHLQVRPGHIQVQIDGEPAVDRQFAGNALAGWEEGSNLALGNEIIGRRAWTGVISRATISTPEYHEDLLAPGYLQAPAEWWEVPYRLGILFTLDMPFDAFIAMLHFMAFMPIGYAALLLTSQRKATLWLLVIFLMLAVGIEASKILIADRHPTVLNVIANFLGALSGAFIASRLGFLGKKEGQGR